MTLDAVLAPHTMEAAVRHKEVPEVERMKVGHTDKTLHITIKRDIDSKHMFRSIKKLCLQKLTQRQIPPQQSKRLIVCRKN